jgi:DNA replication protein DnaC
MDTPEQESTDNANSAQTFSADQQRAYDKCMQMQPPTPVFITGAAGSGKTHVLKKVIEDYKAQSNASKTVAVTASTGLAGTIIGGVTLHAYFSKYFDMKGRKMRENIHTAAQRVKCDMNKRLRKLSVLVIDEISMIKKEEMDIVNMVLQYVHEKPDMPFGGVKVIVCGDFHQLPPVIITENGVQPPDSEMPFAFEADCWHHFDVVCRSLVPY